MFWKRKSFEFTHPEAPGEPIIIKARSEEKAWAKMKNKLIAMKYGSWALTYDETYIRKVMGEIACKAL